jgi:nitrite reductase (NADH) large subunit
MTRLVVVGNGMAGIACLEQVLKHQARFQVTVFGDETHANYNRIMLSSVLAGEKGADDIVINPVEWYTERGIDLRVGVRIVDVDSEAKTVTGADGSVTPVRHVAAWPRAAAAFMPPISGLQKDGVFVSPRSTTRASCCAVRRGREGRSSSARPAGSGGGPRPAGAGLRRHRAAPGSTLMERQLDPDGGGYLVGKIQTSASTSAWA